MGTNKVILGFVVAIILIAGAWLGMNLFIEYQRDAARRQSSTLTENLTPAPVIEVREGTKNTERMVYIGKALAGTSSPYLEFNKADYDKAVQENKVVLLNFYASWCPICRAEAPVLKEGFDSLKTDAVVGFRVNYNDPDTDEDEKQLAKQHEVKYQHTKVIIKNGKAILKDGEVWDKERFTEEVTKAL